MSYSYVIATHTPIKEIQIKDKKIANLMIAKLYVRLMHISRREKSLTCMAFNIDKNLAFFRD